VSLHGQRPFLTVPGTNLERFANDLRLSRPWVSLADVETLVALTQRNDERGVPENHMRVSAGLEAAEDIVGDFKQALTQA
jgi:cystathionine beta-lyase/cystathionine gamma-synthase